MAATKHIGGSYAACWHDVKALLITATSEIIALPTLLIAECTLEIQIT